MEDAKNTVIADLVAGIPCIDFTCSDGTHADKSEACQLVS